MALNELNEGDLLHNDRYEIIKVIGNGTFGIVFTALDRTKKEICAIKLITQLMLEEEHRNEIKEEINILQNIQNEYVVKYIDHFEFKKKICIVTEYFKDGDLQNFIQQRKVEHKKFQPFDILNMCRQILMGLKYLHEKSVAHLDLKPSNIFRSGYYLVIGDLGLAKNNSNRTYVGSKIFGTLEYMCPELLKENKFSVKSDIWSFGCVLYELAEFKKAFDFKAIFPLTTAILQSDLPKLDDIVLNDILHKCLVRDPSERLMAEKLILEIENVHKIHETDYKMSDESEETKVELKGIPNKIRSFIKDIQIRVKGEEKYLCLKTLHGHENSIWSLLNIGEGKMASGCRNNLIKIWDIKEGKCIKTLEGHTKGVASLINVGESRIASGSYDSTIKLWDINSGICVKTLKGHKSEVCILINIDKGLIGSGSSDKTIKIWDIEKNECLKTMEGNNGDVSALLNMNDGRIVSGHIYSSDFTIKIWNLNDGKCLKAIEGHKDDVSALLNIGDDRIASASKDKTIKIWDLKEGKCLKTLEGHKNKVWSLLNITEGKIASGSDDKTIKIWNLNKGKCEKTLEGHSGNVNALIKIGDDKIASGGGLNDFMIKIWNI